jgi:tellurite resistance protein TehA-like permease
VSFAAFFAMLFLLRGDLRGALTLAASVAVVAVTGLTSTTRVGNDAVTPAAVVFGVVMLFVLVFRLLVTQGTLSQRLQDPDATTGLDITAAMLGAFGLATAFADPPLF